MENIKKYNLKVNKSNDKYSFKNNNKYNYLNALINNKYQNINLVQYEVKNNLNNNYIPQNNIKITNPKRYTNDINNNYINKIDNKRNNKGRTISKKKTKIIYKKEDNSKNILTNFEKEIKHKINYNNKNISSNQKMVKNNNFITKNTKKINKYNKDLFYNKENNNIFKDIKKNTINLINSNDENIIEDNINFIKNNEKEYKIYDNKNIEKEDKKLDLLSDFYFRREPVKHYNMEYQHRPERKIKENDKNLNNKKYMEIILEMKEFGIEKIFELSNNRIAIQKEYQLKIYSYKNFKLLSVIRFETSNITSFKDIFIELKNKDLVRRGDSYIEFYKLYRQEYKLFQKIEEYSNSIFGLMNGNLVSCNNNSIKIYSKEKDEYKLISKYEMKKNAVDAFEIESNKLVVILKNCKIFILDIGKKEEKKLENNNFNIDLCDDNDNDKFRKEFEIVSYSHDYFHKNYLNFFKNDKYLFLNCEIEHTHTQVYNCKPDEDYDVYINHKVGYIYNLTKENYLKCEENDSEGIGIILLSHYNNDLFIAKRSVDNNTKINNLELYKYEDNFFKVYGNIILPIDFEDLLGILKLKNNKFIIYSSREIILLNEIK